MYIHIVSYCIFISGDIHNNTPLIFPVLSQINLLSLLRSPGFGGPGLFCHGSPQGPLQQCAEHRGQCYGQPHHVPL